ncbi:Putative disease resistance protein RGA1 [Dendrobium catenatum]|uniref:Disease resistance protein RGA1 n=1 Tax=Dendrobium catenatum TaxID=906689 RepID=A0A2I0X6L9_9ASPA|nr:Putative disease resistance protein RGA1 [Dendrobium catenatum]
MTEIVATSLLRFISEKLASKAIAEFAMQIGIDKELRKLERTLSTIQDVLEDAEARQVKEKALRSWLSQLKELAYDADDVLDEFSFKAAKLKKANMKEKVRNLLCLPKNIAFQRKIALRVKEINERLDEIAEVRSKFHLKEGVFRSFKLERSITSEETGSFIKESEVYGREVDKEKIVEFLMNTSVGDDIGVIGIVGLGGLGKTTLAGLVYNDERVCGHFQKRMWVCVSEEFELKRLVRLIIESATGSEFSPMNMDAMQRSLINQLQEKRFLLVLDDVWSESHEKWDSLRALLTVGAKGSKVIVTTRNEHVASIMGTISPYRLSNLSFDDCWLLFERRAFGNEVERNPDFVAIGKEIVKKCGGVPLAAKALGGLLRFKRTESEWLAIKDNELWKLASDENYEVLPALKLSYDHLSSCLKQCFAYCSIFPKDFNINTTTLVKLWGAEGFLEPSAGHIHWEQIGLQCVEELQARSLFQVNMIEQGGVITQVKMHDLVHDLAQSVAGIECSIVDDLTQRYPSQNSRYVSFICNQKPLSATLELLRDAKKLRTLYLDYRRNVDRETEQSVQEVLHVISSDINLLRALHLQSYPLKALPHTFKKLRHLRYLDLSSTPLEIFPQCINTLHSLQTLNLCNSEIKSIPDSIGDLHNLCTLKISHCFNLTSLPGSIGRLNCLRELDCSRTKINSLPESVCTLSNLHTLGLEDCFFIHELPHNLSNMKSLVNLNIHGCINLTCMPMNLRKLKQLRTLPIFIPGGKNNCTLKELGSLKLEGILQLKNLQNVRCVEEAKAAQLSEKHNIRSLKLSWLCNSYINSVEAFDEYDTIVEILLAEDVLESLQPSKSLEELKIEGYVGRAFPSWMNLSLSNLVRLTLACCACEKIPTLGLLPRLQVLNLVELPLVKHLGSDFYGGANAFSSLQELELNCLTDLEEWCSAAGEKFLPRLHTLILLDCPKLKALPSVFSSVENLIMNVDDKLLLSSLQHRGFPNLKHLKMKNYDDKDPIPEIVTERAECLISWTMETKPEPKEGDPTTMSTFNFGMVTLRFEEGKGTKQSGSIPLFLGR